jgi:hypothetical protein
MRVVTAAVIVASLCGPAFAQTQKQVPVYREEDKEKTLTEKQAERDAERAYRRSLGNIPEQKPNDPWGTVRGDNSAKPAEKPAAAKKPKSGTSTTQTGTGAAKTGTTAN